MAKETDFLRLKRTRLTASDFTSLKVIGRGAFGEVSLSIFICIILFLLSALSISGSAGCMKTALPLIEKFPPNSH